MTWPHIRAALIAAHLLTVVLLSLPVSRGLLREELWARPGRQRLLQTWAPRLGFESKEAFQSDLRGLAKGYVEGRQELVGSLMLYTRLAGVRQGWSLFSRPKTEPVELEIAVRQNGELRTVYRPHEEGERFGSQAFDYYRFRSLTGRLSRSFTKTWYNPFARTLAAKAALAHPDADLVRVRLYRFQTPRPSEIRNGESPAGRFEHMRLYPASKLR